MRFDKFTIKAQEAIQDSQQMALKSGHPEVDTAHLLAALLAQDDGLIAPLMQKIGADPSRSKAEVVLLLDKLWCGHDTTIPRSIMNVEEGGGLEFEWAEWADQHHKILESRLKRAPARK